MSEIEKYKKYLNFKANPRYLTRDFIVPLYTGTEPDILDDSNTQRETGNYTPFPNDMPIVSPKEIQNQPYEQLQLADGGSVERQGFSAGTDFKKWLLNEYKNKSTINKTISELIKESGIKVKYGTAHLQVAKDKDLRKKLNVGEGKKINPLPQEMKNIFELKYPNMKWEELSNSQRSNFLIDFSRKENILKSIPKNYITIDELEKKLGIPKISFAYDKRTELVKFVEKNLEPKLFGSITGGGGKTKYFKEPGKRLTDKILQIYDSTNADILRNKTVKNVNTLYNNYLDVYKQGKLPNFEDVKGMTPGEVGNATTRLAQILDGKKFKNTELEDIRINKNVASKMFERMDKHPFGNPYRSNLYQISLETIDKKLKNERGTFDSLKRKARDILRENNIPIYNLRDKNPKGFNINEIAGATGSSRSKAAEFSQFIDIMEGNLNQKQLTNFQGMLSNARAKIELNPNVFNKEAKNLNSLASVLEEKYGVQLPRIRPATQVGKYYNQERLDELNKLGLDIEAASKRAGYTIQMPKGAFTIQEFVNNPEIQNKSITQFFKDNPEAIKVARSAGFRCRKSVAGPIDVECLADDIIKQAEKGTTSAVNKISKLANFAKGTGNFVFDALIGKTPGAAAINFGINVPFAIAEAQEGKPGRQVLGTATDIIGLGPLVGTTEKDELTKAMGAGADLYLKINEAMEKYNDIGRQRQLIENSRESFVSPEETPSDIREQDLQFASKELDKEEKKYYNFLSPYLNKQGEVVYPKDIEKGLQILEDQEKLRKAKSNLGMKNIPSVGEDILSTDNISFEKSDKNIDKKIEQLESEKPLYGSEIDKNMTPELMDVIYEGGARGGAADGGRIGLKEGGGPKMGRRGFLGLLAAGAAAAPEIIKGLKGEKKAVQVAKLASKIKFEKTEGMYPWFPDLVEKIKTKGKPFEEKEIIMEASYKHEPKGYGGLPKGVETVTRHVDGDTEFLLREYPDGRIAVDIHSPRNQEGSSTPVTLYYRPTMELKYYSGVKVEPAEFKVLEKEPRYFANGPDDVDIEMSETRKIPGKNTIYGDVEAAERFATGKIENRKIIPAKQARREQMEDAPTDFIEETSPYGPVYD
jgi:ribosomal protein L10